MVVMFLYDRVPLSYYRSEPLFGAGLRRSDLRFLSSGVVLIVLLYEIETLYAKLLRAVLAQRRERNAADDGTWSRPRLLTRSNSR
jgi:hypothetical protein